ncbi:hypothetical protein [Falsirhodobacter halotolerans]|uniref:hypothetical protein n=1 Tax=Falsirhodobacter halotolerans TaxID=1146892 RepID=UPI001FD3B120|nr:hypothetical protein [Falsirhodobacter halotolerans]MCJ8138405.1 hypothetical protein [Falsirhodobacter halotolerans]
MPDRDLAEVLPNDLFNHPNCFGTYSYRSWELDLATPALVAAGFEVGAWRMEERDSFGPLVRSVALTKDSKTERFFYG